MTNPVRLTESDYAAAATALETDIAAIKAFAEVESAGDGFLPDGRPRILFERHIMRRELYRLGWSAEKVAGAYTRNPNLVNPATGGYKGGSAEWLRMDLAAFLSREAALKSASWGKFQIMGFNHALVGFDSVQAFVNAMYANEANHLAAFVQFVKGDAVMCNAIKTHDWRTLARRYNGVGYAINEYDKKLANAYAKFSTARVVAA